MKYDPQKHHRRSIRLKGYDYAQAGLYFITLCTQNRICLFGQVTNGAMVLNAAGAVADRCWLAIPEHYPNVQLHEYVIMPNHMHGIIEIVLSESVSPPPDVGPNHDQPQLPRSPSRTIGSMVRGYKIGVTKWFREHRADQYPVGQRVWQRNYWEHIIRSPADHQRIAQYIIDNPKTWYNDRLRTKK